ncbi:pentapeptide repeat-containing protein [Gracilibacillus kekensis]|uniref:Pentapeptide repeat-containing protein n=1 Tax=Gracilibacillus kekensis TaxID=1027249 RepID=A0A1M7IV22_9BACI|nr:pentapeptide repeat-containing protein [Gracilibacillus kekensis]SHM44614.1 Pentapeptide repeat-containing protein [Gracilibacillus kekensis]
MIEDLKSDCKNCFGLCCVALPYGESSDFPFNKAGGEPCRNLCSNNLCSIHDTLREHGFRGCVSYECFGAGQHVSQSIYNGKDWRVDPDHAEEMFAVFPIVQQLHEMLWYLHQALALKETEAFQASLLTIYEKTLNLTSKKPEEILKVDVVAHRKDVNELLIKTSEVYRGEINKRGKSNNIKKESHYLGANLSGLNLQGENFRGKLMIGSDLSQSDMRRADFIGADLRDADISGSNLTEALFLTQSQINSAIGDIHTQIPSYLEKPSHWLK